MNDDTVNKIKRQYVKRRKFQIDIFPQLKLKLFAPFTKSTPHYYTITFPDILTYFLVMKKVQINLSKVSHHDIVM